MGRLVSGVRTVGFGAVVVLAACGGSDSTSPYESLGSWCDATAAKAKALSAPELEGQSADVLDQAKSEALDTWVENLRQLGEPSPEVPKAATDAVAAFANEMEKLRVEADNGADIQELLKAAYANPDQGLFAAGVKADEEIQQACVNQ